MGRLEDMRLLIDAVDHGGFSAAAMRLGVSKQLVSRRISELEARLGVQLVVRTTRRLTLTDLGRDYVERARRVLAEAEAADLAMIGHHETPRGRLRLSAPVSFGTMHLSPLVAGFLQLHPAIEVELDLSDRTVDLVAEGYDMAVRIGVLADSSLVARKLTELRLVVCASPDYLHRRGGPATPSDLKDHACLIYGHAPGVTWPFQVNEKASLLPVKGPYRANNGELLRDAAIAGLGVAQLPDFIVGEALASGALVTVLDAFAAPAGAAYAVHPAHRQRSPAVSALTEYLAAGFGGRPSARTA